MKKLNEVIQNIAISKIVGSSVPQTEIGVADITTSSNEVKKGSLFIAYKGSTRDGHTFIDEAIARGASVVVCEEIPKTINNAVAYVRVDNIRPAIGTIANNFFDSPSLKLKVVGVTGTNGKTTISTILYRLFQKMGYKAGLISTIENCIGDSCEGSNLTTPDCISLHRLIHEMADKGVKYVFMECSSHAIDQDRISGVAFAGGIFSNLTHDHLDYHISFSNYRDAKKKFFTDYLTSTSFAITNLDDKNGLYMLQNTKAKCYTYSCQKMADYKVKILEQSLINGMELDINQHRFFSPLIGEFNAYNLAAIFGCAQQLGIAPEVIAVELSDVKGAKGRMEKMPANKKQIIGIVDYAHTPDAIQNTLKAIKHLKLPSQSLIVIVGCGGDRDKSKRSAMGKFSCAWADKAIFTSDNPRSESAEEICHQMEETLDSKELGKVEIIIDRKAAIARGIALAKKEDIVVIAGKGHEEYQIIGKDKAPFSDQKVFEELVTI